MPVVPLLLAASTLLGAGAAPAAPPELTCDAVAATLREAAPGATCTASPDLTTANDRTTPQDNSDGSLPPLAFTPRSDRQSVAPEPPLGTQITRPVPGLQVAGAFADDAQARFVVRLPTRWNGRLVTGIPSAVRSEYGLDLAWSDYLVRRGYAYVATNKGTLNARPTTADDPLGCAVSAPGGPLADVHVRPYAVESPDALQEWVRRPIQGARLARRLLRRTYGRAPRYTYAVGVSVGSWVVRRLLETRTRPFAGGIDWEGVLFTRRHDIVRDFTLALRHWPGYRASGFDAGSPAARAIRRHGFPPDLLAPLPAGSYYGTHADRSWNLLACLALRLLDAGYRGEPADYPYAERKGVLRHTAAAQRAANTGRLRRPLITVTGTMDAITPIATATRPYRRLVQRAGRGPRHRVYEVQNGSHADPLGQSGGFRALVPVQPHAHAAFERLVAWVERSAPPPPSQCVPRGEMLARRPGRAGRAIACRRLLARSSVGTFARRRSGGVAGGGRSGQLDSARLVGLRR